MNDINDIVSDNVIPWNEMRDSTILVTGSTGLIGSALIHALCAANKKYNLGIRILAFGRNERKAKSLIENYGIEFFKHDICKPIIIKSNVNYIFHCAAITKSSEMATNPVEVINISIKGTDNILTLAKKKDVKSMVYLSSMEVYGRIKPTLLSVTEDILGNIDLKNPRSCYPESKRMCECMCNCWFSQYGIPVKIARLAQTFGAGTPITDTRIFTQFALSAINGKDIVLHTDGRSRGNYCYINDVIKGLFLLLLKGKNGEAYNIVNPKASMTIRQMALFVSEKVGDKKVPVVVDKPSNIQAFGYAPETSFRLSAKKLEKIGWKAKYNLAEMYRRMIQNWHEEKL